MTDDDFVVIYENLLKWLKLSKDFYIFPGQVKFRSIPKWFMICDGGT